MLRTSGRVFSPRVVLLLPVLLAAAAHGGGLTEQVRTYDMTVELEGEELVMVRRTTWARVVEDGHDAWRVMIEHESTGMPTSVDTLHVSAEDLRPLRRYIKQGDLRIRLHYTHETVRGQVFLPDGNERQIEATLDGHIVGDVLTAIANSPVEPGYTATFAAFDPTLMAERRWKITAGHVEIVETPLGALETYPIELSDADRPGGSALYWVTLDSPHHIVKSESQLPDSFGGGLETITIRSVSALPTAPASGQ